MSKAAEKYADEVLAIVALKKPDQFRQLSHGAINDLRATMINSYCAGAKDCEAIQAKLDKAVETLRRYSTSETDGPRDAARTLLGINPVQSKSGEI